VKAAADVVFGGNRDPVGLHDDNTGSEEATSRSREQLHAEP